MNLYHFTSMRHLYAIGRYGLTVGDVPTDIQKGEGRCGGWLTSGNTPEGLGREGSSTDKKRVRFLVDVPERANLVKWTEWAPKNVTVKTIAALNSTAMGFDSWHVYFGVIDRAAILQCLDTAK